jgi:hypothetical protein
MVFDQQMNAICCLPAYRLPQPIRHGERMMVLPSPATPLNQPLPDVQPLRLIWHASIAPSGLGIALWWFLLAEDPPEAFDEVECVLLHGTYQYADLDAASARAAERRALVRALAEVRNVQRFAFDDQLSEPRDFLARMKPEVREKILAHINERADTRLELMRAGVPNIGELIRRAERRERDLTSLEQRYGGPPVGRLPGGGTIHVGNPPAIGERPDLAWKDPGMDSRENHGLDPDERYD